MKRYMVVMHEQIGDLEHEVNKMLHERWKLAGGISLAYKHEHSDHGHTPGHIIYAQALEKENDQYLGL